MSFIAAPHRLELSLGARQAHDYLAATARKYADDDGAVRLVHRSIAKFMGRCLRSVRYYLAELRGCGLIEILRDGLDRANRYRVYSTPQTKTDQTAEPASPAQELLANSAESPEVQTSAPETAPEPTPTPTPTPSAELVQEVVALGLPEAIAEPAVAAAGEDARPIVDFCRTRLADATKPPVKNPAGFIRAAFANPAGFGLVRIEGRLTLPATPTKEAPPMRTIQDAIEHTAKLRLAEAKRRDEREAEAQVLAWFHGLDPGVQAAARAEVLAETPALAKIPSMIDLAAARRAAYHSGVQGP